MAPPVPAIPFEFEPGAAAKRANPRPTTLPEPLWQAILRTYDGKTLKNRNLAWTLGFAGVDHRPSLDAAALVAKMDATGDMANLMVVYARFDNAGESRAFPDSWNNVSAIFNTWSLEAGKGVSTGMKCVLFDRPLQRTLARTGKYKDWFCEDDPRTTVHGDRDCFREMIKVGRGLHLCVARQMFDETNEDTWDDFHVDEWQVPSTRKASPDCDYHYMSEGFWNHVEKSTPWWLGEQSDKAGEWARKKSDSWKSSWDNWHPFQK